MKSNDIKIIIERPIDEVFIFTIAPQNTPQWIDWMLEEKTSDWPIKIGTIYENTSDNKNWSKYVVSNLEENKIFEITKEDKSFLVRYTYNQITPTRTELTYHEESLVGDLADPFPKKHFALLKEIMEK
jgi:hypothetical protein